MYTNELLNCGMADLKANLKAFLKALSDVDEDGGMPDCESSDMTVDRFYCVNALFGRGDFKERLEADERGTITYKGDEYGGFKAFMVVYVIGENEPDVAVYGDRVALLMSKREILGSIAENY